MRRLLVLVMAQVLGWIPSLDAAPADPPFRVSLSAPTECPDQAELVRQITARTEKARVAQAQEEAREFEVVIAESEQQWLGRFLIRNPDGTESVRMVPGENCSEVVDAIALIAAVVIDPHASTEPLPPPSDPPLAPEPQWSRPVPSPRQIPAPASATPRPWRAGVGVICLVTQTVSRDAVTGLGVQAAVQQETRGVFAPAFRLALVTARSPTIRSSAGFAQLSWTSARLTTCPIRVPAVGAWGLRPCGFLDAGRLSGAGMQTVQPRTKGILWSAAGLTARLEWTPPVPVSVGTELGVVFPFARDRYYFAPDYEVHTIPGAGAMAGVDVTAHFR